MDDKENLSWKYLLLDFCQNTTFHGVRYIAEDTKFILRRLLWFVAFGACLGVFLWFVVQQLNLLLSHEKSVDVEVLFRDEVLFPTVTICNQNLFKRSLAHKFGQHDVIVEGFSKQIQQGSSSIDTDEETVNDFDLYENTILTGVGTSEASFTSVTVEVCKKTCIEVMRATCCSLLYNKRTQTCTITALEPSMPDITAIADTTGETDYYRRHQCNIQTTAECQFTGDNTCKFQIDYGATLRWKVERRRGNTAALQIPDFDHTAMSDMGYYLYANRNRQTAQARFLSPYFSSNNTCVEFFYQIRKGRLKVLEGLRDVTRKVWERGPSSSTDWERAYIALPEGYIRVTIQAQAENGGVNVALDDINISPCQPVLECRDTALGLGYSGTKSETIMGRTCENWDQIPEYRIPKTWNFNSLNRSDEKNYCRNPDSDSLGLWCITNIETMEMDYCEVPACPCREDVEFQCGNGRCVSQREQRCNKHDDCGDLSDEFDCPDLEISVNCTFEEWNCTYSSPEESKRMWEWRDTPEGRRMLVDTRRGREGDFAILQTPTFNLSQTGCFVMRYNMSQTDKLDVFFLEGERSMYRQHLCTLPGINHTYYEAGIDPTAPTGYNFSIDIPDTATNLMFIASSEDDLASKIELYQANLVDLNCSELYAPPTEAPTTVLTLNFTGSNESMWWNTTTEMPYHLTTNQTMRRTSEMDEFVIGNDDVSPNMTTLAPEVTTEYIPIYYPECLANYTGECDSCLKDAFFWTREQNESTSHNNFEVIEGCKDEWPDCERYTDLCPGGPEANTDNGRRVQRNCPFTCGMCIRNIGRDCTEPEGIQCSFFDECICGYKFTSSNKNWVWKQEPLSNFTTDDSSTALIPHADDNYLRVHNLSEASVKGDWIRLFSPIENFTETSCLNFRYFSRYMDVKVFAYNETYTELLLSITFDGQERHWHPASTNIQPGRHGVVFELTYSQFALKNAGIDNVTVTPGLCESGSPNPNVNCTFDVLDWCGYMDVSEGPRNWYRTLGATSGYPFMEEGKYFLRTRNIDQGKVSRLLQSPSFTVETDSCLKFDFFDSAGDAAELEIKTLSVTLQTFSGTGAQEPESTMTIWRVFGTMKDEEWHYAQANISSGSHRLIFEVTGDNYRVGIKNVSVVPGLCPDFNCSSLETLGSDKLFRPCDRSPYFVCLGPDAFNDGVANCEAGEDETHQDEEDGGTTVPTTPSPDSNQPTTPVFRVDPIVELQNLYRYVGHQGADMIYQCEWNGQDCSYLNFTTKITDYGLCYMFNSLEEIETDKTGARFGLRLTLNIEQYEYMTGPNTDAGIKIFLHNQTEEPRVRDLGFAIAPGLHALVGVQRNDAWNLPFPWGNCSDDKQLKYYKEYTQSACEVECETDELVGKCECRDAYMPSKSENVPPICSIPKYFSCAVPEMLNVAASIEDSEQSENSTTCSKCPQPCNQTVYEPSLSYATLSTLSVDQILFREDFDLEGMYEVALETVQRVNPDIFTQDLNMLSHLEGAYEEMDRHVSEFLNENYLDAIAYKIVQAVGRMRNITVLDCRNLLDEIREYKTKFESNFKFDIDLLNSYNDKLGNSSNEVKQVMLLSFQRREVSRYLSGMLEETRMWTTLAYETIDALDKKMINTAIDQNEEYLPAQYFKQDTRDDCASAFDQVKASLTSLTNLYAEIANRNDYRSFDSDVTTLDTQFSGYRLEFGKTSTCIDEYYSILRRIVSWLNQNNVHSMQVKNRRDLEQQEEAIEQFKINQENLKNDMKLVADNFRDYAANQTTKMTFLRAITEPTGADSNTLMSKIEVFTNRAQTKTVTPLKQVIDGATKELEALYKEALNLAVDIDAYMRRNYFYPRATDMQIWKLPGPNIEEPQNPVFYRETLEMWKIWDQNMAMSTFVRCTADNPPRCAPDNDGEAIKTINNALEQNANQETNEPPGYFRTLESEVEVFESDITSARQTISNNINEIAAEKVDFEKKKTIDAQFIAENFMKVDVYFKQLKYQKVEQTKAYEILDFLSDVGGYLGLLLGASVLTLCEVIDLFLYNGVKKTLASSDETTFSGGQPQDAEAVNGKAVPPSDNDLVQTVDELDDPPDGVTNYGMSDDRGFTSQFNKI